MGSLFDVTRDPAKRKAVVDDCCALIDAEVSDKGGLTGIAIKTAFATVKGVRATTSALRTQAASTAISPIRSPGPSTAITASSPFAE